MPDMHMSFEEAQVVRGDEPSRTEIELKYLEVNPGGIKDLGGLVHTHLISSGILEIHSQSFNPGLITSQRDTPDFTLFHHGRSLRARGSASRPCFLNRHQVDSHTDICIKGNGAQFASGATIRPEYEAVSANFEANDFDALRAQYSVNDPENAFLYETLGLLTGQEILEHARLHVERQRFVIEAPRMYLDLREDQRFIGELNIDRVRTFAPRNRGRDLVEIAYPYVEVEFEALDKECAWDKSPKSQGLTCNNLSSAEKQVGIEFIGEVIIQAVPTNTLRLDRSSKGNRAIQEVLRNRSHMMYVRDYTYAG